MRKARKPCVTRLGKEGQHADSDLTAERERWGGLLFHIFCLIPHSLGINNSHREVMPALLLIFLNSLIEGVYTILIIMEYLYVWVGGWVGMS